MLNWWIAPGIFSWMNRLLGQLQARHFISMLLESHKHLTIVPKFSVLNISILHLQAEKNFVGRRNSEIVGHLGKKRHATSAAKACKNESSLVRKPLSPVSLSMSSRANIVNFMGGQKSSQSGTLKTMPPYNKTPMDTPSKSVNAVDDENRNPNTLPVPVASTPPTTSVPMLTALTPATPCVSCAPKTARKILEQEDHSFEELRAGFVRLRPQS
jgi:protein regulator of cytokinesis 1